MGEVVNWIKRVFYKSDYYRRLRLGWVITLCAAIVGTVVGGIGIVAVQAERHTCEDKAGQMGLEEDYGFFSGCMVSTSEGWRDIEDVRVNGGET